MIFGTRKRQAREMARWARLVREMEGRRKWEVEVEAGEPGNFVVYPSRLFQSLFELVDHLQGHPDGSWSMSGSGFLPKFKFSLRGLASALGSLQNHRIDTTDDANVLPQNLIHPSLMICRSILVAHWYNHPMAGPERFQDRREPHIVGMYPSPEERVRHVNPHPNRSPCAVG